MPLYLIHGDNHFKSREFFHSLLDKYKRQGIKDRVFFNAKNLELDQLTQALESKSLFGGQRLVIIEDLHTLKNKKTKTQAVSLLKTVDPKKDHIIIWEKKSLTKTQLKKLSPFNAQEFKTSPTIFKFLESIGTSDTQQIVSLYRQACTQDSPEFVFYMMARHLRQLLLAGSKHFKGAPWQQKS